MARENSVARLLSTTAKIVLFGFSVAFTAIGTSRIEKKSTNAHIQIISEVDWYERNGVDKTPTLTLYKRVSIDFKTQEGTPRETVWTVGEELIHPEWSPAKEECGPGKFHACSRPYFCDEFRSEKNDRYIAIEIKLEDAFAWEKNPDYPHKIAFRAGKVLYECDRFGKKKAEVAVHV